MIKTIITSIVKCDEEMAITLSNGDVYELKKEYTPSQRRIILRDYIFTKENMNKLTGTIIRVKDDDKERVCSLLMTDETIILMDAESTKQSLCTCSECGGEGDLPSNEIAEEFEDIFGEVEHEDIKRAQDLILDDVYEDIDYEEDDEDDEEKELIKVENYKTIQKVIEKISDIKERVEGFFATEVILYTERDENLICIFGENDNKDKIKEDLEKAFEKLTVEDLQKRILVILRIFSSEDNATKEKECNISISDKEVSLYGKSIVRSGIDSVYRDCNGLSEDETTDELETALKEIPEEFETIFGKFESDIRIVRLEEDENGEWIESNN